MKKFSKQTAIILSVILGVVLVVGLVFSFVPIQFGNKTWVSLSNSINISSDIVGGIYGEFEIKTEEPTRTDIEESKSIIRSVLSKSGYNNANVYDIAGEKIRVELSYPKGSTTYQDVINSLKLFTSGKLMLQSASSVSSTTVLVDASESIESVSHTTQNNVVSIVIKFNDYGVEQYKSLCSAVKSSGKIYMKFGEESAEKVDVSSAISNGEYSSLTLSGYTDSYEALYELMQRVEVGCMPIEFNANTVSIDTMSASLTAGEAASSPEFASFFSSSTYVILISAIVFVAALILAIFAAKFGLYAILIFVTMLINSVLFLVLICLIPSVEFGLSAMMAIIVSMALIYAYSFDFAFSVKKEYNNGKSFSAALETTYKNKLVTLLISNVVMFLASLAFILLSFGELTSVGVIFGISSFLSLITNIFVIPFLIKICISFGNFGTKLFMLKKRSISEIGEIEEKTETEEKEAE